ncbi:hypothetical protein RDWZM_003005 [Blomia tropicalis]|uniref:FAM65 N-terminal domain-containing protein n=1 Tax=Blomia tropicalis TaxID=40697 RepID=A0A9Q0MEM4_BLOTA|nr:hypothetical protein RDWZM_003005 [Blomia tropicalis]
MEIPNIRLDDNRRQSFILDTNHRNFHGSSSTTTTHHNFILRKSKSIMYDPKDVPNDVRRSTMASTHSNQRGFISVDEGVDDDSISDEEEEEEDDEIKLTTKTTNVDRFPPYNMYRGSNSHSSSSASWLGGMFSPRFTTVSANTAAKSASLSFQQMKSFTGFGVSPTNYMLNDEYNSNRAKRMSPSHHHLTSSPSISERNSSRRMEQSPINSHRSMAIPYTSMSSNVDLTNQSDQITKMPAHIHYDPSSSSVLRTMRQQQSHNNLAYSSSSGCSTQSSASSTNSLSQHFARSGKSRSSLREAAQNFRDFVQHYELGLIECISSVEEKQQMNNQLEVGASRNRLNHEEVEESPSTRDITNERRRRSHWSPSSTPPPPPTSSSSSSLPQSTPMSPCSSMAVASSATPTGSPVPNENSSKDLLERFEDRTEVSNNNNKCSDTESAQESPLLSHSLRLQLAKVRSLRDQYETGYRCSEALEKMMKLTKKTRDCDREYRANEKLLAEIEAQLEAMIGTFRIKVEDLEGFARICPRDNYEIEFRHGKQRQVLRVRIGKSLERTWDGATQEVEFRGALKPTIVCRLREIKSRWNVSWSRKNITLGVTSISMSELLVAVSKGKQILLDANASGSLKLKIICSWQPKLLDTTDPLKGNPLSNFVTNQSFRSENLDSFNSKGEIMERKLNKSATISPNMSSFISLQPPPPPPPTLSIPRPESLTPIRSKFGFPNLRKSSDLSRSLLTLPSFGDVDDKSRSKNPSTNEIAKTRKHNGNGKQFSSSYGLNRFSSTYSLSSNQTNYSSDDSDLEGENESLWSASSNISQHESIKNKKTIPDISTAQLRTKISNITNQLANLQSALEDYRGQYIELTMMSIIVSKLIDYFDEQLCFENETAMPTNKNESKSNDNGIIDQNEKKEESMLSNGFQNKSLDNLNGSDNSPSMIDDIETALAEFDFLESVEAPESIRTVNKENSSSNKPSNDDEEQQNDNRPCDHSLSAQLNNYDKQSNQTDLRKLSFIDLWSSVLLLHLNSSLEQLGHVGSWILKGRETQALARLRADSFACELIHDLFVNGGRNSPLGKDTRVLELWNFASERLNKSERGSRYRPYIMSWRQLCQILIDLMVDYGLYGNSSLDDSLDEDALRYSAEWLSGLIVPFSQTKVTIFDIRAFFELDLWKSFRGLIGSTAHSSFLRKDSIKRNSLSTGESKQQSLSVKRMLQIALDVDLLMRKSKKISSHTLETILFDRFNVNSIWIPSDVTLTIIGLLYEIHSHEKQSKLTTNEVKKLERYREIGKMATNWIIWLLQDGRLEIREHVLSGLESGTAFIRRASCFGIMYMLRLMKSGNQKDPNHQMEGPSSYLGVSGQRNQVQFYGQELDCLLFMSAEDHDGRVREEAKKALKCLGHFGQQRLNQMERNRMGFFGGSITEDTKQILVQEVKPPKIIGRSMPNLNKI